MPIAKPVFSRSSENWITCANFGPSGRCEKTAYELYKAIFHEHAPTIPCSFGDHVNFIFCSERCKRYYQNSHVSIGNLPPGYRTII